MTSEKSTAKTDEWMLKADDRGHFNIEVLKDGTWLHEGDPIKRDSLVKLFSSVLHLDDDGQHWLVTPVEKGRIDVEVAPLFIIQVDVQEPDEPSKTQVKVSCKTGETCTLDSSHPISMIETDDGELWPVVMIRDGLMGHFNRASYYDLMEQVTEGPSPEGKLGLWSKGQFFVLESEAGA